MATKHPDFPHIAVFSLPSAEAPKRGAFFATRKGDTLSSIASSLMKSGQWSDSTMANVIAAINNSQWNRANCYYRTDSSNCLSKRVTSGGYLALCQSDGNASAKVLGNKYPVIWIPSKEYANPGDVPASAPVVTPTVTPAITPAEPEKKANMLLWVGIAIAVIAAGGIIYATTRAGK
jgi:hypothetical protein